MADLKELQKAEALKRMKVLKLMRNVRDEFEKDGTVYYSERQNKVFDGILYWVSNNPEYVNLIKDFENKYGALVYHCQLLHTSLGDMLSMLYVSSHPNEWEYDNADLAQGYAYANVANLDDNSLSEIGMIGIAPKNGGITRTA